jgi:RNA polymerase sigma factor (sigma-70 family)
MAQAIAQLDVAALEDDALLRRYTAQNDGQALEQIVRRYSPMVYAAARRQVGDPSLADDVAQCAFVAFARRAGAIRSGAVLGAWLLQTTRFTAANALKAESNRRRYEDAARFHRPHPEADPAQLAADAEDKRRWEAMRPVLDRAISRLSARDQSAVILRFFRGFSLSEVAATMGTSEEAARKRVSRALRRLRKILTTLGAWPPLQPMPQNLLCAVPNAAADRADFALAALLSNRAVEAASSQTIAHVALAAKAAGDAARTSILHGVFTMAAGTKLAVASIVGAAVLGAGYAATRLASAQTPAPSEPPAATQPAATQPATPAEQLAQWQDDFEHWTPDESMVAYATHNDSEKAMAHAFAVNGVAIARLVKLAKEKWGDAAEQAVSHACMNDTRADDATAQITVDGDHAKLVFKSDVIQDLLLVRENGAWKMDLDAYQQMFAGHVDGVIRANLQSGQIFQKLLADATAGKYATADDLVKDITQQVNLIPPP